MSGEPDTTARLQSEWRFRSGGADVRKGEKSVATRVFGAGNQEGGASRQARNQSPNGPPLDKDGSAGPRLGRGNGALQEASADRAQDRPVPGDPSFAPARVPGAEFSTPA